VEALLWFAAGLATGVLVMGLTLYMTLKRCEDMAVRCRDNLLSLAEELSDVAAALEACRGGRRGAGRGG